MSCLRFLTDLHPAQRINSKNFSEAWAQGERSPLFAVVSIRQDERRHNTWTVGATEGTTDRNSAAQVALTLLTSETLQAPPLKTVSSPQRLGNLKLNFYFSISSI